MTLQEAISRTPFWRPFEAHRLKRIRSSFNALSDAIYSAIDDIASLVRCRDQTSEMGAAVVDSAKTKHELCQLSLYLRMDFSRYLRMVSKCNKGGAFAQQTKRFRSPRVVLESVNLDGPWRRGPQPRGRPHFKVKLPVSQGPGAFIRK
jgi:hypothetical protein